MSMADEQDLEPRKTLVQKSHQVDVFSHLKYVNEVLEEH
jgi:hypothetical protein